MPWQESSVIEERLRFVALASREGPQHERVVSGVRHQGYTGPAVCGGRKRGDGGSESALSLHPLETVKNVLA